MPEVQRVNKATIKSITDKQGLELLELERICEVSERRICLTVLDKRWDIMQVGL